MEFTKENIEKLVQNAIEQSSSLSQKGEIKSAIFLLESALSIDKENTEILKNLFMFYYSSSNFEKAKEYIERLLEKEPKSENYNNLALCYSAQGKHVDAIEVLKKAISFNDALVSHYHNNISLQYAELNDMEKAEVHITTAISLEPNNSNWYHNYGIMLANKLRINEAKEKFKIAIEKDSKNHNAVIDMATCSALNGDFYSYFEGSEERKKVYNQFKYFDELYKNVNYVTKENIKNIKKEDLIVVFCEQGYGDFIHFSRFLNLLDGFNFKVHSFGSISGLFKSNFNYDFVDKVENPKYKLSICSLPYLFEVKDFENTKFPYIKPTFNVNIVKNNSKKNVGLVWAGNPAHPNDKKRSIPLVKFKEIIFNKDYNIFSLQTSLSKRMYKDSTVVDLTEGTENFPITNLGTKIKNFEELSACIQAMDFVITVDTAPLHLAGAMNKKTYALIPYIPDWRWGIDNDKTIWYDSVTLIRQKYNEPWESVVGRLKVILYQSH